VVFATSAFPRTRAHARHARRTTTFGSTDFRSTLTPDDLREIERASQITGEGDRYPDAVEQLTGR
jgi:hypothetical protein